MSNIKELDVPWLGALPENWRALKLKYLCNINTGSKDTQDKLPDGEYPFFVRSPHIESLNEFTHNEEAIMTAGDGVGVGKVFHYYEGKFAAHQRVYVFTKFKNVSGKYLYYYLMSNLKFEVLMGGAKSTVDSIRRPMLSEFPVVFPTINIQEKIVGYLDRKMNQISSLIDSKEKYISLLEKQRQSIITEAVIKGLNPNVKMKDSGIEWIGEIPEHWDSSAFKRVLAGIKDGTHGSFSRTNEGETLLSAKNVFYNKISISENESLISLEDYLQITKNGYPKKNDLLMTIVGTIGRVYLYDFDVPLAFQRSVAFLRFNWKAIPKYYYYYTQSKAFVEELNSFAKTSAQSGVYMGDVANINIVIPTKEEQSKIALFLDNKCEELDLSVILIRQQISKLKEYRQSLIYEAVTGKIDVRDMELD